MSNEKHSDPLIKNEDTLRRRAWVEQALAGVRVRTEARPASAESTEDTGRPRLYVVESTRGR